MNKVILTGNLTADPVLRTTTGGTSTVNFTLAVGRKYKDSDGNKPTDFIACVAWKQTADLICKYLSKGRKVNIFGSLQTRTWDDLDGNRHYATEVVVDEIEFLTPNTPKPQVNDYYPIDDTDAF